MKLGLKAIIASALIGALTACAGTPTNLMPVSGFEEERYLGTWYEIARLDHSFEKGLTNVTANYSLRDDGKIKVLNRGWSTKKQKWKDATGKAKFAGDRDTAHLKVSFFGPFYGDYIVFDLDTENYTTAFIGSSTDKYLWLLARTPTIDPVTKQRFITQSSEAGYDASALVWVDQTRNIQK